MIPERESSLGNSFLLENNFHVVIELVDCEGNIDRIGLSSISTEERNQSINAVIFDYILQSNVGFPS